MCIETPLSRVERALPVEMREEVVPFPHHHCLFWSEASRRRPWELGRGNFDSSRQTGPAPRRQKNPLDVWKERETTQRYSRG